MYPQKISTYSSLFGEHTSGVTHDVFFMFLQPHWSRSPGAHWRLALALMIQMQTEQLELDLLTHNSAISATEKCTEWQAWRHWKMFGSELRMVDILCYILYILCKWYIFIYIYIRIHIIYIYITLNVYCICHMHGCCFLTTRFMVDFMKYDLICWFCDKKMFESRSSQNTKQSGFFLWRTDGRQVALHLFDRVDDQVDVLTFAATMKATRRGKTPWHLQLSLMDAWWRLDHEGSEFWGLEDSVKRITDGRKGFFVGIFRAASLKWFPRILDLLPVAFLESHTWCFWSCFCCYYK